MSIQVAVLIEDHVCETAWATFTDEVLCKGLDWVVVRVESRAWVEGGSADDPENVTAKIWYYEVVPTFLVDDLWVVLAAFGLQGIQTTLLQPGQEIPLGWGVANLTEVSIPLWTDPSGFPRTLLKSMRAYGLCRSGDLFPV